MATVLGLVISSSASTVWYLADTDRQAVSEQIAQAMVGEEPLTLPLVNNGLLVLRAKASTHFCVFDVDIPDGPSWAPFRPGVSSYQPERVIM
jgi:hypothetical protein